MSKKVGDRTKEMLEANKDMEKFNAIALDNILEDSEHRLIYQESIMKYLIWLGISEPQSYDVIKKIAKKKFKEPELKALKEQLEKENFNYEI